MERMERQHCTKSHISFITRLLDLIGRLEHPKRGSEALGFFPTFLEQRSKEKSYRNCKHSPSYHVSFLTLLAATLLAFELLFTEQQIKN